MAYVFNPLSGNFDFASASGGASSNSFSVFQTPFGTSPTAASPTDTMTLTSSDDSVVITGDSSTDTIDFKNSYKVSWRPSVACFVFDGSAPPSGGTSYTFYSYTAQNGDRVLFSHDNKIYVISGVGTSIVSTLATDGQAGNGDPTKGDQVAVVGGLLWGGTYLHYTGSGWSTLIPFPNGSYIAERTYGSGDLGILSSAGINVGVNGIGVNRFTNNGIAITRFSGASFANEPVWGVQAVTSDNITTNATPLSLTFSAGIGGVLVSASNRVYMMKVEVVASRTDVTNTDLLVGSYWQALYWNGSSFTAVGTTQTIGTPQYKGTGNTWTVDLTSSPGSVVVTGESGKTIQWGCNVTTTGSNG